MNKQKHFSRFLLGLILSVFLVAAVTYLFLGSARAAFIPLCAIPVSLIGVFIFVGLFGFSINLLLLFGLVLANAEI